MDPVRGAGCDVRSAEREVRGARALYDLWAATYPPTAHNPLMRAEQAIVEPLLRRLAPRRALDVGTGSGRYLDVLAAIGASTVGIDFSLAMLARARRPRICGDARRLPFRSGRFDLVNASLMVGDVADLAGWALEIFRVLRPGGHLVYSDFHPTWTEFGWRRTFRSADGATHDLGFEPHTIDAHLDALTDAGFGVDTIREPRLVGDDDAGVRRFRKQWGDAPVVVVFHATKQP